MMLGEARRIYRLTVAGVAANFLLAIVAVAVPAWLRYSEKRDAKLAEHRVWSRFIEAFTAVSDAQEVVVAAGNAEYPAGAYTLVELQLQRATEALAKASANELPVKAVLNSVEAQQLAAKTLARLVDLKLYGRNLLTDDEIQAQINQVHMKTVHLLNKTKALLRD